MNKPSGGDRQHKLILGGEADRPVFQPFPPSRATVAYDTFWKFATERQEVFFRKMGGSAPPWTDDPIIERYKFTNAYRASDRVSQYIIRNVIYEGAQSVPEVFFRIILFKLFNKIETWELLKSRLGPITWESYSFTKFDDLLTRHCLLEPESIPLPTSCRRGRAPLGTQQSTAIISVCWNG